MRRRAAVAAVGVLALLGAAGACGGDDDDAADSGGASDAGGAEVGGEAPDEGAGGEAGEAGEGGDAEAVRTGAGAPAGDLDAQAPPSAEAERIVYTAEVRVRVDDPAAAAAEAIRLAEQAGGSLAGQQEQDGQDVVSVTVRVPVAEFREALDALTGLGEVLDRQVAAEEVGDQIVDLEGRLENARASADRLRELYATAEGVDQIVSIEQALTQREAEVESLAGQLQQLEDRADRSTITVDLVDEGEPVVDDDEDEEQRTGFVGGLRTGWDVIVGVAGVAATLAGFLLPFVPFALVVGGALLLVRRRGRRGGRAAPASSPSPPGPSAAD